MALKNSNVSVGPYSSIAMLPAREGDSDETRPQKVGSLGTRRWTRPRPAPSNFLTKPVDFDLLKAELNRLPGAST